MAKIKVIFDRKNCIGAGACVVTCPKFWEMGEDGKANLLNSKTNSETGSYELEVEENPGDLTCLKDSASSCPVQVIQVIEQS